MSLILTKEPTNWNVKMTRPDGSPKSRDVKDCEVLWQSNGDENLTIWLPRPDLHLCALAVEFYMAWLKDTYDVVWPGKVGGLSYLPELEIFMRTPMDSPYDRRYSNPTNLFIGFTSTHEKTPSNWEPYKLADFEIKVQGSTNTPPQVETPENDPLLSIEDSKAWGFWIETRTGEIIKFKVR